VQDACGFYELVAGLMLRLFMLIPTLYDPIALQVKARRRASLIA